ncbi:hypothetical protein BURPSS13_C0197 [Burkholderia pseudomallei S13]|nr:hypothetical protein BURPSS13_C0197 [Burkholderia pseudomallei S13]
MRVAACVAVCVMRVMRPSFVLDSSAADAGDAGPLRR